MALAHDVDFDALAPVKKRTFIDDHSLRASLDFAEALEQKIRDFWAEKGYLIETRRVYTPFNGSMRSGRYDVRSNLKNALPPDWRKP